MRRAALARKLPADGRSTGGIWYPGVGARHVRGEPAHHGQAAAVPDRECALEPTLGVCQNIATERAPAGDIPRPAPGRPGRVLRSFLASSPCDSRQLPAGRRSIVGTAGLPPTAGSYLRRMNRYRTPSGPIQEPGTRALARAPQDLRISTAWSSSLRARPSGPRSVRVPAVSWLLVRTLLVAALAAVLDPETGFKHKDSAGSW